MSGGREILSQLVRRADVLVENFRPSVKRRLGIDYQAVAALNPRLVYASISGFGQEGPYSERPAFDQIVQGMSGLMSVTGFPGQGPLRAGFAASDVLAGLYLAQGILIALFERSSSGAGQWVQTSLLECLIAAMDFQAARVLVDGVVPEPVGNDHPSVAAMGVFPATDGVVNIGVGSAAMFVALCRALGADAILNNPDYATEAGRLQHRAAVNAAVASYTSTLTRAELVERLNAIGVPCGPIYDLAEALADPQVRHQKLAWGYQHENLGAREVVGQPIQMTRTPHQEVRVSPPRPGAQTDEILHELGLGDGEVETLRSRGVV